MGRKEAVAIHEVLIETFIASHTTAGEELILDFDATDDAAHGRQEGRFFHCYYDHYCFSPLYVFCGEQLLSIPKAFRGSCNRACTRLKVWPNTIILNDDNKVHQESRMKGLSRNRDISRYGVRFMADSPFY